MSTANVGHQPTARADERKAAVGLLGIGLMGSAMAGRLLERGLTVLGWDHDPDHLSGFEGHGGEPAKEPGQVVSGANAVITMLPTAAIVLDVVEPLLEEWPADTVWLQMSSVGAAEADQLTQVADAHGITLVDAPVSGSTRPAEEGHLTVLASGPDSARAAVEPIFDALASRVLWVGEAGMGSRLKLATNHWMISTVTALAESLRLCEAMGLEPGAVRRAARRRALGVRLCPAEARRDAPPRVPGRLSGPARLEGPGARA
jgi:3-hydroxyisobutyrate dehydrogenase